MPNVEWLLKEATAEERLSVGARTLIDDERWRATLERLEVGPGLRVFLTTAEVRQDVTLQPRDSETVPWMGSQISTAGRVEIDFLDGQRSYIAPDHTSLFRPSVRRADFMIAAGQSIRVAGYGLRADRVVRLFDGAVPHALRPLIESEIDRTRIIEMPGTRRIRQIADSLFSPGLNGSLRTLFIEGLVLQLFAVQAAAAQGIAVPTVNKDFDERQRPLILDARDRLLSDMRKPPSLVELATAVGLSEKRLNAGFRAVFGATAFELLRNERLEHARIALEADAASVKEIAFRVGYNHVTNFINAFTARYGVAPKQYARRHAQGNAP